MCTRVYCCRCSLDRIILQMYNRRAYIRLWWTKYNIIHTGQVSQVLKESRIRFSPCSPQSLQPIYWTPRSSPKGMIFSPDKKLNVYTNMIQRKSPKIAEKCATIGWSMHRNMIQTQKPYYNPQRPVRLKKIRHIKTR